MTVPGHEVRLSEPVKITNTREEMLKGNLKKPLVFKGYKTEKDRIVKIIFLCKPRKTQSTIIYF